jgi:GH18 family chitinase
VVAYIPNWAEVNDVDPSSFAKLTHVNIAFENPVNDDGDLSFDPNDAPIVEKAHENRVKVLVSIGGGGESGNQKMIARYAALQSDQKRAAFVGKLVAYLNQHQFDGLDVDLEGPGIGKDYGPFISDLSKALIPTGKLLTSAVSQGYGGDQIPSEVLDLFSFVNVMAYDGTGPWDPKRPGQHSSMDYAKSNVAYWVGRGLPKSKAVLGVPFYGYGFGPAFRQDGYKYSEILSQFPGAENADQIGNTIWYNGLPTMKAKAKYVMDEGLAGVMIWSLDQDVKGEKSLLAAIDQTFHPAK